MAGTDYRRHALASTVLRKLAEAQSRTLYMGNLPFDVKEEDLHSLLSSHGKVNKLTMPLDRETGRQRGFGYAEMATDADAQSVRRKFHGHNFQERALRMEPIRESDLPYLQQPKEKQALLGAAFGLLNAGLAVKGGVDQTKKFHAGFKPETQQQAHQPQAQGGMK